MLPVPIDSFIIIQSKSRAMKNKSLVFLVCFMTFVLHSQVKSVNSKNVDLVRIHTIEWMTENWQSKKLMNGESISLAKNSEEWMNYCEQRKPCYAYYNFDSAQSDLGLVYNFFAIHHPQFAPEGWRVPETDDWLNLVFHLGGFNAETSQKLKHRATWEVKSKEDNISGFSALPCGYLRLCGSFTDNRTLKQVSFWRIDNKDESGEKHACSFAIGERNGLSDVYLTYSGMTAGSYVRFCRSAD
jgi:uncharacterized protein (TIGR02145 family)